MTEGAALGAKWRGIFVCGLSVALAAAVLAAHLDWTRPQERDAPADIIYYAGGTLPAEFAILAEALPLMPQGMTAEDLELVRRALGGDERPLGRLLLHYMEWLHGNQGLSLAQLHSNIGLATVGDWDLYNHEGMPVLRAPVADRGRVLDSMDAVAAGLGTTVETLSAGGLRLRMVRIGERLRLAALLESDALMLSLVADGEDGVERRFGADGRRAARRQMAALARRHGHGSMGGFVELRKLAAARGGGAAGFYPADALSPECAADLERMAAAAPRLVFGIRELRAAEDSVHISQHLSLEIARPQLLDILRGVQGTVSAQSRDGRDKILGLGLGHNLEGLAEALAQMRELAHAASPACPALAALRQLIMGWSPTMPTLYAAMLSGARGLGLSLYSLEPPSALLSIETPEPERAFAALSAFLPPAAGALPADGGALELQPPPYLDDLQVMARPGRLLIYSGAPAAQVAGRGADGIPGLFAMAFNQQRMLNSMSAESWRQLWRATGNTGPLCPAAALSAGFIHGDALLRATDIGLQLEMTSSMRRISSMRLAGHWDGERLGGDCQWRSLGTDSLAADGSGRHLAHSAGQSCARSAVLYDWHLDGGTLTVRPSAEQRRPSCTAPWQDTGGAQGIHRCRIITAQQNSFQCRIYAADGTWQLHRYRRRSAPP